VMSCMEKLGDTFYASQKFKDAAPVYRRLVGIREKSLGANPLTLSALFKMAKVHERLSQVDEAEEHYKRGVALGEKVPGPLYANLCDAYSALLKRSGRDAQEALRLETAAKQRRERDGISAARVGEGTLKMAAIQIPASESLEAQAEEDEEYEVDEEQEESDQSEQADLLAPVARPFDPADLDAIKAPAVEGGPPQPAPAKPDILSRVPKSQAPGSFLKRKTEETGMPGTTPSPASQFSKGMLDSLKAPDSPTPQPFSAADLNGIGPGGAAAAAASTESVAKPYTPDALDAIKPPSASKGPSPRPLSGATTDATSAAGATAGPAFDLSALDAIKSPNSSLSKPPVAAVPAAQPEVTPRDLSVMKGPSTSLPGDRGAALEDPGDRKSSRAITRSEIPDGGGSAVNPAMIPALVALVLIICCVGVVGFSMFNKSSVPNNAALTSFAGKTFRTADRKQELTFSGVSKGEFVIKSGGAKKTYETQFISYGGGPLEEFQALTGAFDNDIWLQSHFLGLKSEGGVILYDPNAPEVSVLDEMWHIADAAQLFYKAHGRYPRQPSRDPGQLKLLSPKLSFVNALTKQDLEPEIFPLKWPDDDVPNNVSVQTKLEKKWLDGQPFSQGQTLAGTVRCAQIGSPLLDNKLAEDCALPGSQRIDEFFVEGYNRYNELIRGGDGKVFIITLKKGTDVTGMSAPPLVPAAAKSPVLAVISEFERPTKTSVILRYLGMLVFFAIVIVVWLKWPAIIARLRREQPPSN